MSDDDFGLDEAPTLKPEPRFSQIPTIRAPEIKTEEYKKSPVKYYTFLFTALFVIFVVGLVVCKIVFASTVQMQEGFSKLNPIPPTIASEVTEIKTEAPAVESGAIDAGAPIKSKSHKAITPVKKYNRSDLILPFGKEAYGKDYGI